MDSVLKSQFKEWAKREGFSVNFGATGRNLEYREGSLLQTFGVDTSEQGNDWLTLEHKPKSVPRDASYWRAFERCWRYLESCGYKVEVWPEGEAHPTTPKSTSGSPQDPTEAEIRAELQDGAQRVMRRVKFLWLSLAILAVVVVGGAGYLAFQSFGGVGVVVVLAVVVLGTIALGRFLLSF